MKKKIFERAYVNDLEYKKSHLRLMQEYVRMLKDVNEPEVVFRAIVRLNELMGSYMEWFAPSGAYFRVHSEYVKDKNDHLYRIEIFDKDNRLVEKLEL